LIAASPAGSPTPPAYLARDGREDAEAAYLLGESRMKVEDFRRAKVTGYDMRVISRL